MSFRWMRTAQIANGKFMEAIAWGKETSGYAQKNFGVAKVDMWIDSFGDVGTMRWTFEAPDLATFEKVQTSMMADQNYWQMVDKALKNGLFVDGSTRDYVSRQL